MSKRVSVIIPTYKRSKFLGRAIRSVLNQTYENIEIIVVDDNMPNSEHRKKTEEEMLAYSNRDNVLYIKNCDNLGGALTRNQGILKATGYYVTFLDDDDVYLPDKIKAQYLFMEKECLDMSFTDIRIHNKQDKLVDYREHKYIKELSNKELLKQHIMHHLTPTNTYMFKKDALDKLEGFDNVKVGQEFMLMLKAIEQGFNIGYLSECHVIQYVHDEERISVGEGKLKAEIQLFDLKKKYFKELNIRQRVYVRFRHNAVMAVVSLRSKRLLSFFYYLARTFLASPWDCLVEVINYIKKIKGYKRYSMEAGDS